MKPLTPAPGKLWQLWQAGKAIVLTLSAFLILDLLYFLIIWPDWKSLEQGAIPKSRYMENYTASDRIRWQPIQGPLPQSLTRPFIIAEDSRFYQHHGYDWQAIRDAMRINWEAKRWRYGASTISQQTVKNLFLSHERSLLRKWHELVLTVFMERNLSKNRILTLYLNIAEFGPGIFGVEAASQHYFGRSFHTLGPREAAALAATLPSPKRHNPQTNSNFFRTKRNRVIAVLNLPKEAPIQTVEFIAPPEDDEMDEEADEAISINAEDSPPLTQTDESGLSEQIKQGGEPTEEVKAPAGTSEEELDEEALDNFDPSSDYD